MVKRFLELAKIMMEKKSKNIGSKLSDLIKENTLNTDTGWQKEAEIEKLKDEIINLENRE